MKKTKKMTSGQKIILGMMFLVVFYLCAIIMALISPSSSPPANPGTQPHPPSAVNQTPTPLQRKNFMAQIKCERFIKDRLASPSSAKFSREKSYKINGKPANYHVVTGIVESQNRLGVWLRSEYRCDLHYLADNPSVWVLDYLDIED